MREEEACVWAAKLTIIVRWCGAWLSLPPLAPPGADHQIHHHSSPPRRHWGLSRMPSAANDGDRSPGSKRSPALVRLQPPVIRNRLCSQRRRYTFARGLFLRPRCELRHIEAVCLRRSDEMQRRGGIVSTGYVLYFAPWTQLCRCRGWEDLKGPCRACREIGRATSACIWETRTRTKFVH